MNELQVFIFKSNEIRTVIINNEPWFVGKDVAEALGYKDTSSAILDHIDEEDRVNSKTQGCFAFELGQRGSWLINESGLYSLILSSKLPEAKQFKRWVTSDVLPTIRKTGKYELTKDSYMINDPIERAKRWIEEEEERQKLRLENQVMKPKADYFDSLVERNLLTNLRDTAKELHLGQKEFIEWLLANKYVYRDAKNKIKPYMVHVDNGLFEIKEFSNSKHAGLQTLITPKGRETFRILLTTNAIELAA